MAIGENWIGGAIWGVILGVFVFGLVKIIVRGANARLIIVDLVLCIGLVAIGWFDVKTVLGVGYDGKCLRATKFAYVEPCPIVQWRQERWFPSSIPDPKPNSSGYIFGRPNNFDAWSFRLTSVLTYILSFLGLAYRYLRLE